MTIPSISSPSSSLQPPFVNAKTGVQFKHANAYASRFGGSGQHPALGEDVFKLKSKEGKRLLDAAGDGVKQLIIQHYGEPQGGIGKLFGKDPWGKHTKKFLAAYGKQALPMSDDGVHMGTVLRFPLFFVFQRLGIMPRVRSRVES